MSESLADKINRTAITMKHCDAADFDGQLQEVRELEAENKAQAAEIEALKETVLHIHHWLKDYNDDSEDATHAKRFAVNCLHYYGIALSTQEGE